MRIGICDVDPQMRHSVARALVAEGFAVELALSGSDAVERFTHNVPDLVILELVMPDMDGREVCRQLRAAGVDVPVVFVSLRVSLPDKLSAFAAGGDDFVPKPFAVSELLARIRALGRRSRRLTA